MNEDQKYTAPALEKGLDILDVLSSKDHGMTQAEIARTLNRSVSEIFRMLAVLKRRALVDVDPDGDRYYLTAKLFEMASKTPILARLTVAAGEVMQELAQAIDESVHLAILSDDKILVIGQVDNPGYNVLKVRLGTRVDAWLTSSGRVILANQRPDVIKSFLKSYPLPDGEQEAELLKELAQLKQQGFDQKPSNVIKGVTNISVAILGHDETAVAAMTIPHIERHICAATLDDCRTALIAAANKLSRAVGGRGQTVAEPQAGHT